MSDSLEKELPEDIAPTVADGYPAHPDSGAEQSQEMSAAAPPLARVKAPSNDGADVEQLMRRMSRRSFLWAALATGASYSGWRWLISRRDDDGIPWPFRRVLELNEDIARDLFNPSRLAPQFARSLAVEPRPNGDYGLGDDFDPATWKLTVEGLASGENLSLSLHDIKALPRVEMTTELKCIEGWSVIVNWTGARFSDFAAKYGPETRSGEAPDVKKKPGDLVEYVGLETPDGGYYVGLDMASALHPQTLLCYEMNGKPLTLEHGAPLRLVTPLKYGVKHIKRIGTIRFSSRRPADYWAEQGYDWYVGH